jgi:hypothetical protein
MTAIPHHLFEQAWPEGEYRLVQLGFIVDDIVAVGNRWAQVFGVGPFHVGPRNEVACTYRGTESALDMQVAVAQAGPVQIELIKQFCERPSVYRDLVASGDARFHQVCTVTRDYPAARAHYLALGYELATEIEVRGQHIAYFDTMDDFGFYTEIAEHTAVFLETLDKISRTCAQWDGVDPVRIMTREGYRTP